MKAAELSAKPQDPALRADASAHRRLPMPEATQPVQIDWGYVCSLVGIHVLSLLMFVPWYFSWTGVVVAVLGFPLYGLFGITLCYHRILTHRGLTIPKWLEHIFAILGVCTLQDTPARWVAVHRLHHQHSDRQDDPHSPLVNFLWAHVGWVVVRHREHSRLTFFEQYARDVLRDPFYLALERNIAWFWVFWLHAAVYFLIGLIAGRLMGGHWMAGVQFGASLLVWGVFFRTVFVWHATWAVNSVTHVLGYRNYETSDASRNFWLVALVAYGEGWHNNHHADQRAAAHGHRWWEIDMTYAVVRLLEWMGLAKDIVRPRVWRQSEAIHRGGRESLAGEVISMEKATAPKTPDPFSGVTPVEFEPEAALSEVLHRS